MSLWNPSHQSPLEKWCSVLCIGQRRVLFCSVLCSYTILITTVSEHLPVTVLSNMTDICKVWFILPRILSQGKNCVCSVVFCFDRFFVFLENIGKRNSILDTFCRYNNWYHLIDYSPPSPISLCLSMPSCEWNEDEELHIGSALTKHVNWDRKKAFCIVGWFEESLKNNGEKTMTRYVLIAL